MFWSGHRPLAGTAVGAADEDDDAPGTTPEAADPDACVWPGTPLPPEPDPPDPPDPPAMLSEASALEGTEVSDGLDEALALVFRGDSSEPPEAQMIRPITTMRARTTTPTASARRRQ